MLGVTGSAGKSTTARLAEAMLLASGSEVLSADDAPAENAYPTADLVARVLEARPPAWCVAELTSNHLAVCSASPHIACITNVWPDHVDQHGSLAAYVAAKRRIVEFQTADDWVVVNADDPGAVALASGSAARALPVTLAGPAADPGAGVESGRLTVRLAGAAHDLGPVSSLPPSPGAENGLLAGASALLAGASAGAIARALAGWQGLAMRRERLGRVGGSDVIRDVLAATPAKAAAGLALHPPGSVILIAGGYDDLGGGPMHSSPQEADLFARAARWPLARVRTPRSSGPPRRDSPRRSPCRPRERRRAREPRPKPRPTPVLAPGPAARSSSRPGSPRRPASARTSRGCSGSDGATE